MKKVLTAAVATGILLGSSPLHAATIYDKDNTKLDLYGRFYLYYENTDEGKIKGDDSRFGFNSTTKVNDNLNVFARAEFRYEADRRYNATFNTRNTYVGLQGNFGQVMVGNFDSIYYQAVSGKFDNFERSGYLSIGSGSTGSRADSIAWTSTDFSGFKLLTQVRHYEKSATTSGEEEFVFQIGGTYKVNNLDFGLSAVLDNKDAGFPESLIGLSANYKVMPELSLRAMYETMDNAGVNDDHIVLGTSYNYGKGDIYGNVGRHWNDETYIALGMNYKFSKPMRAFLEYATADAPVYNATSDDVITVGFRYDF